jgi:hypothetical protein
MHRSSIEAASNSIEAAAAEGGSSRRRRHTSSCTTHQQNEGAAAQSKVTATCRAIQVHAPAALVAEPVALPIQSQRAFQYDALAVRAATDTPRAERTRGMMTKRCKTRTHTQCLERPIGERLTKAGLQAQADVCASSGDADRMPSPGSVTNRRTLTRTHARTH